MLLRVFRVYAQMTPLNERGLQELTFNNVDDDIGIDGITCALNYYSHSDIHLDYTGRTLHHSQMDSTKNGKKKKETEQQQQQPQKRRKIGNDENTS